MYNLNKTILSIFLAFVLSFCAGSERNSSHEELCDVSKVDPNLQKESNLAIISVGAEPISNVKKKLGDLFFFCCSICDCFDVNPKNKSSKEISGCVKDDNSRNLLLVVDYLKKIGAAKTIKEMTDQLTKTIKMGVFSQEKAKPYLTKAAVAVVRHMKAVINKDPKAQKTIIEELKLYLQEMPETAI